MSNCTHIEDEIRRVKFKVRFDITNLNDGQVADLLVILRTRFQCLRQLADIIENK